MRDHWRDEGQRREDTVYRGRHRERSNDRRKSPAASTKREPNFDVEVKIKGRAKHEEAHRRSVREDDKGKDQEPPPYTRKRSSRSPRSRRRREGSYEKHRGSSKDRRRDHSHHQNGHGRYTDDRRRLQSRSPRQSFAHSFRERPRSPHPYHLSRTDHYVDKRTGNREQRHSRSSPPRQADYHSHPRGASPSLAGDFYVPSAARPRPGSPAIKDYREDRIRDQRPSIPKTTRTKSSHRSYPEEDLFNNYPSRARERSPVAIQQSPALSRERHQKSPHRRRSLTPSRETSERPTKRLRSSRSPLESNTSRSNRRMHSTRRIQVLDSTPGQQSPPRPIPTFDTNGQTSGGYPMHGTNRPSRLQLNTQHSHSASPQWTPTSSHHGSPQSASPYSHGRGGWVGQAQHYQNQPG